jgi:CRP-like cAMP-binding protein
VPISSFSDGHQAIADIYLPGDIIGLDRISWTRPGGFDGVIALTSIVSETIDREQALELITCRSIAIYVCWLLGQRQRRTERHVAAISSLDARGRMATMALDFYTRLSRKRLITGSSYSLPLTQHRIAAYLGLTVAHVNRVLRFLRDEQIVTLERYCMTILNLKQLKTLAQKDLSSIADFDKSSSNEPTPYRELGYLNEGGFPVSQVAAANGFP